MVKASKEHTSHIDYAGITLNDSLLGVDLSIERALELIPEPAKTGYRMMYDWFLENTGTIGPQLKRNDLPFPDAFTPYAQRGIHVPSGQRYAANVTSRIGSIYSATDSPLIELPDGTWTLVYSAHRNNKGNETFSRWNDALIANMRDGIHVGVYLQEKNSSKYYRALAFVESYRADTDVFMLRGPITAENANVFTSPLKGATFVELDNPSPEKLQNDIRSYELVRKAIRTGQEAFRKELLEAYDGMCAITCCDVPEVLQAAHIMDHRGLATNIPSNGLLLRSDIHLLYDSGLLSIEPQHFKVVTASRLAGTDYAELNGMPLRIPKQSKFAPDKRYLAIKHREFEMIGMVS